MRCTLEPEQLPITVFGDTANLLICPITGRIWVCVDGVSVLRVKVREGITYDNRPVTEVIDFATEPEDDC